MTAATMGIEQPSLRAFAYVLHHPEVWPEGFRWDASHPAFSSVYLLVNTWGGPGYNYWNTIYVEHYSVMLGTTPKVVERLMLSNRPYGWWPFGDVSAAMMGRAIDRYVGARDRRLTRTPLHQSHSLASFRWGQFRFPR